MVTRKCNIRYGTALTPYFAKFIDAVPPTDADFDNTKLFSKTRVAENPKHLLLRRPSLSAILSAISDQKALYLWQKAKIDEMGLSAFKSYMTERTTLGKNTHSRVEEMLKAGHNETSLTQLIDSERNVAVKNYMKSALPVILEVQDPETAICEKSVRHPTLAYQGRFDAVVQYKNNWSILDWKTSPAQSSFSKQGEESLSYLSYVRQLAAYASAFNYDHRHQSYPIVKLGLLVSLKEDGTPAEVYEIPEDDMEQTLEGVKNKLKEFWVKVMSTDMKNIDFAYKP